MIIRNQFKTFYIGGIELGNVEHVEALRLSIEWSNYENCFSVSTLTSNE